MASASEKDGIFWSLVAWGGGIVAAIVVYWIVRGIFGGSAPDGLVFAGVAFVLVGAILDARLGPRDTAPVAQHHPAPAAAPKPVEPKAAEPKPVEPKTAEPKPVEPKTAEPKAVEAKTAEPKAAEPKPAAAAAAPVAAPVADPVAAPATEAHSERVSEAAREAARLAADLEAPVAQATRPTQLDAPRGGTPDDLKRIKGVGPKLEELLHKLGYYHFDQIAAWTPAEVAWVDTNIEDFPGRATRDDWVGQAKTLMAGGTTEFSQRVDRGEVY